MRKIDLKAAIKGRLLALADRAQRMVYDKLPLKERFSRIHRRNFWGDSESLSGTGSNLVQTQVVRHALPKLLEELGVRTLLDVPCGDFLWMNETPLGLVEYIGGDIVPALVAENNRRYGSPNVRFVTLDITKDRIPTADLIFCRDCLVHLSFKDALCALRQFRASGATYLLTTTFVDRVANRDIVTGEWRPLNLELAPFAMGAPLRLINEQCTEDGGKYADKSLGLWKLQTLPS